MGLVSRAELTRCLYWKNAFAGKRKDHRYYELVEDTIRQGFDYRYFAIKNEHGEVQAVQPFFILDQDLIVGAGPDIARWINSIRRVWPRFLKMRTLMVGCAAGEGHLDGDELSLSATARILASDILTRARDLRAPLIVLKEFPAKYREPLECFLDGGFSRVPSLPMTRLDIDYPGFDEYMNGALNSATRRKLRKKFKAAAQGAPIELDVIDDVTSIVDEVYPLYLQLYDRSKLHFEKLTKEFLSGLGRLMPDKVRFFIWRQHTRVVTFSLCMLEDDAIYAEYIGLDYTVALRLHLYHYDVRDMIRVSRSLGWFRPIPKTPQPLNRSR